MQPIELHVSGHPYVKKSNQRVQMRGGRPVKINTKMYNQWAANARRELRRYSLPEDGPIDFPVNLQCEFYPKTKGRVDLSALYEGIQDILVEIGFLADDNYKIVASHDGSGVFPDKDNPGMDITITAKN